LTIEKNELEKKYKLLENEVLSLKNKISDQSNLQYKNSNENVIKFIKKFNFFYYYYCYSYLKI